jgi:phage shock protein B
LAVPGIVFLVVIAPLWIIFHYLTAWKRMRAGNAGPGKVVIDRVELERMRELCEQLERRIESLETILDEEAPEWRNR